MNCSNLVTLVIESNLTSIGSNAFSGCTRLRNVTYLGLTQPSFSGETFSNCTSLSCITVTPDYLPNTFCDKSICVFSTLSSSSSSSDSLSSHSESEHSSSITEGFVVEVTMEGFEVNETNMKELKEAVSILVNVNEESLTIKSKVDEEGNIQIIVIVENEETANIMADALNQFYSDCHNISSVIREKITCDSVLRYVKSARVVSKTIELSLSCSSNSYQLVEMMMIWMITILIQTLSLKDYHM